MTLTDISRAPLRGKALVMRRITAALALLLLTAIPAAAQVQNGTIGGSVKDQQGGVLPGVTATLTGVDVTRTFVTDSIGEFRFLELAPGPYKLSVSLNGFQDRKST